MLRFRTALRRRLSGDRGLSMIEVVVALFVFTLIALGMSYSLITMQRLAYDTKNRETAANLASAEIDRLRVAGDVEDLDSTPASSPDRTVVNGIEYRIARTSEWVPTSGSIAACGSGGGNLLYKRVNLSVTWDGMLQQKSPVVADTIISPSDRVNDPSAGTITIRVRGYDGLGRPGVTINVVNVATGVALDPLDLTDTSGCSYALKVPAATYKITPSMSGWIDINQLPDGSSDPKFSKSAVVTAGNTFGVSFDFDNRLTLNRSYASNAGGPVLLPTTMDTSYFQESGSFVKTDTGGTYPSVGLYPSASGYSLVAGKYVATTTPTAPSCLSPDPTTWAAGTSGGANKGNGVRTAPVTGAPGSSAAASIPMGLVTVTLPALTTSITATTATSTYAGDPGCTTPMTYTFTKSASAAPVAVTLALPYGSWSLKSSTATILNTVVGAAALTIPANTGGIASGGIVTLDPRPAA